MTIGEPPIFIVEYGRRVRRAWAELTRAQLAGEPMPSVRELARRCGMPASSTAQTCIETLVAMEAVEVLGRTEEPNAAGVRQRITGALRVVKLYGWECFE
jgi:hypothetical protein